MCRTLLAVCFGGLKETEELVVREEEMLHMAVLATFVKQFRSFLEERFFFICERWASRLRKESPKMGGGRDWESRALQPTAFPQLCIWRDYFCGESPEKFSGGL